MNPENGHPDGPERPFFGFHYDIARGAWLRPRIFRQAIERAAALGYTHFVPYLENFIRLPILRRACPRQAYTPAQWKDFESVADAVGIELVPHFNVAGHTAAVCAAYPELCGGTREFDLSLPRIRKWVRRGLKEFCRISQARYFLIGGDEWQAPDRLLASPGADPGALWVGHLNEAVEYLVGEGRCPIVWHDMLLHHPAALDRLSRDAVVAFWHYDYEPAYEALEMFTRRGFRVMMAGGTTDGCLDLRRQAALRVAYREMRRYGVRDFLMTSWEQARWETQAPTMELAAALRKKQKAPSVILRTASRLFALRKSGLAPNDSRAWRSEILRMLDDPAWSAYPECRAVFRAEILGNRRENRTLFRRFHYAAGPMWAALDRQASAAATTKRQPQRVGGDAFGCRVIRSRKYGDVLRVKNGGEEFAVYPKFGATLQDWTSGGRQVIPHQLPGFLRRGQALPGGFRSYKEAGGFRPIWSLGIHQNPCMLWQHPFAWELLQEDRESVEIALRLALPHVSVCYRIVVRRGKSGFVFAAQARNHLDRVRAGFNFNLVLALEDWSRTRLDWKRGTRPGSVDFSTGPETAFWVDSPDNLLVENGAWKLRIAPEKEKCRGYFVDWGTHWITPDLRGLPGLLRAGEWASAKWIFSILE